MKKHLIYTLLLIFLISEADAQGTFQPKRIDNTPVGIIYDKEFTFDIRLHTYGFALGVNIGRIKTYYRTRFYQFEIGELKHTKENRQSFDYQSGINGRSSRSFIFGKRNSLFALRAAVGEKKYLTEKAKDRGLSAGYTYSFGPTLGILKPYYLEFFRSEDGRDFISTEKYSDENASFFLDERNIFGSAGFSRGLKEISFVPGFHAKAGVHLDWGAFDEFVKAIEAGFMLDVFVKKMPILVENNDIVNAENRPFFLNLYLNIQLGKRW